VPIDCGLITGEHNTLFVSGCVLGTGKLPNLFFRHTQESVSGLSDMIQLIQSNQGLSYARTQKQNPMHH